MTYRIDDITKTKDRSGSRWRFDFKGLHGAGEYADFYSGTDGKGLYWLGGGEGFESFDGSIEFDCPLDLTDGQAYFRFCAVLDKLGWGPEDTP